MIKKLLFLTFITSFSTSFSQEAYYNNGIDLTLAGTALKDALAVKIIATHTRVLEYTSSGPDTWDATKSADENPANTDEVILFYGWESGTDQDITNDYARNKDAQDCGTSCNDFVWNREHVFPKSLANPTLDTNVPGPATDAHHLRAADRGRNSARSNRKYGNGTGNSNFSADTFAGLSGTNTNAWYPGDKWKGDAARMIMYMYLRYGEVCLPTAVGVGSKKFTEDEMIDLFLQWNVEDTVSDIEIARNNYHENTSNYAAQGNRNPFIDNPYLATRIWGGNSAEDRWDFYKKTDIEAPTTPTSVAITNIALTSLDISWDNSNDNIGVTGYNVYVNDILEVQTTNTNITVANLNTNTEYRFTIIAKDLINNMSAASSAETAKTLEDTEAPTTPTNVIVTNETDSSFKVSWTESYDNNAVSGYEIYVNNILTATTASDSNTVSNLNASTTYSVEILAKDIDNNKSSKSGAINATTNAGTSNGITELFISEYVEPDGGNNKAIEIVNLTNTTISLEGYSLKKQSNGGSWVDDLPLNKAAFLVDPSSTSIIPNDVFVIIHAGSAAAELTSNADLIVPNNQDAPYKFASPVNFNGNDPVGLFRNGVLIDIIGEEGNGNFHIENFTYRRKSTISEPNATFNTSEWDVLDANTFNGIGSHTTTLSTENNAFEAFKMFPNPTNGDFVYFSTTEAATIHIFNVFGKLVQASKITKSKNSIDVSKLATGIYLLKINSGKQFTSKKLIVK